MPHIQHGGVLEIDVEVEQFLVDDPQLWTETAEDMVALVLRHLAVLETDHLDVVEHIDTLDHNTAVNVVALGVESHSHRVPGMVAHHVLQQTHKFSSLLTLMIDAINLGHCADGIMEGVQVLIELPLEVRSYLNLLL